MTPPPLTSGLLVIFGISGDLARKKLLPALYHLVCDNLLPAHFEIIGITRRKLTVDELIDRLKTEIDCEDDSCDLNAMARLRDMMRVVRMNIDQPDDYHQLKTTLDAIEDEHRVCLNRLFYLSVPPQIFGSVVDFLKQSGLGHGCQHGSADSRIMVEKPFGHDLASAQALIERLTRNFSERQIYRIDHYLAKETAQNILVFRSSNPIFQSIWDGTHISRIEVTGSETIGIEQRAAFYEGAGALRDFIQNHLLQLLALVTMELPAEPTPAAIHAQKLKLMQAIQPIAVNEVATRAKRGQYQGYREEVRNPHSVTETFAQLDLRIQNARWKDVPITLTSGKRLDRKSTEISLTFGDRAGATAASNQLVFRIQPGEGIALDLLAKKPGFEHQTERVEMSFDYHRSFGEGVHPDAYERVIMDGIRGDQTLFASSEEVLASWHIVEHIIQQWAKNDHALASYAPGTSPAEILAQIG